MLQNIYYSGVFFNFESKTSGIKNLLYNSAFENIKVPNRDYSSQQKIENVITVIDKKIQLLHQINDNLAELSPNNKKTLKRVFLFILLILVHSLT